MSRRGHNRERQIKKILEQRGMWVCRVAGSLGDADLVAAQAGETPLMVECKSTLTPYAHFQPADRAELLRAAEKAGFEAILAWWPSRGKLKWIPPSAWPKTK